MRPHLKYKYAELIRDLAYGPSCSRRLHGNRQLSRAAQSEAIDALHAATGSSVLWLKARQSAADCSVEWGAIMIFRCNKGALGTM